MKKINYEAWALYENLGVFTAAALWCERNPYYLSEWEEMEYIEVRNLVLHILRHQLDSENYPEEKRNFVILDLAKRFDEGKSEFLEECKKFTLSREQLKAIARKNGSKPKFLFDYQLETNSSENTKLKIDSLNQIIDNSKDLPLINNENERELTKWLKQTWINEGKPDGTKFFDCLKSYVQKTGSPIAEHYTSSKDGPGIRWNTGRATNHMRKKTIQNKVSEFKRQDK